MSEEQGKPKRWYKNWKSIVLLLVILCVVAFIIFLSVTPKYGTTQSPAKAYVSDQWGVQNAVAHYQSIHNESVPTLNSTYTNADCSNCSVINISALVVANGGMLRIAPDSLYLSASGNDNCGGNASLGCSTDASYIWIVDANGSVFSYCAGAGCATNNSGYQDVWP